jgi:hypothetical protein
MYMITFYICDWIQGRSVHNVRKPCLRKNILRDDDLFTFARNTFNEFPPKATHFSVHHSALYVAEDVGIGTHVQLYILYTVTDYNIKYIEIMQLLHKVCFRKRLQGKSCFHYTTQQW